MVTDRSILQAALIGYQRQIDDARIAIAALQKQLGRSAGRTAGTLEPMARPRRKMSAAARKRISAAQKKRWAEYKKQKG
jgi:hypothetical protein